MNYRRVLDEDTCGIRERWAPPPLEEPPHTPKRWKCPVCNVLNTKYRSYCHECGRERTEED